VIGTALTKVPRQGWVLVGRGANGLLPLCLLAVVSRHLGLQGMGAFAAALALTAALAEVADINSQRHLPRLRAADGTDTRVAAYDRLRWLLLLIGLAPVAGAAAWTATGQRAPAAVVVAAALPMLIASRCYAAALVENRYVVLGLGPVLGLAASVALTLLAARSLEGSLWGPALGLIAGKTIEALALRTHRAVAPRGAATVPLSAEWARVRYLVYQVLVSAVNARLVIPYVAVVAGAAAAGLLSVGINLLSVVTLMALAFTVPAYRSALETGLAATPREAFARVRHHWQLAVALGAALTVLICAATPWVLPFAFRVQGHEATMTVALVAAGAVFEPMAIFAGSLYHASLQDRRLFRLGLVNVAAGWLMTGAGGLAAGAPGMAAGFLASRAVSTLVLYVPLIRERAASLTT